MSINIDRNQTMLNQIKKTLKDLGFRENEIKTYLALTELGESSALEISKNAGLARTTVISILNSLEARGYLTTHKYKSKIYYWIESPQVIGEVFQNKAKLAGNLDDFLSGLYKNGSNFPFVKIYDTKKGIKKFTENILLKTKKKSIIYTIDTPKEGNYSKVFSEDLKKVFYDVKKKRQIFTKTLFPSNALFDINHHKIKSQDIELREMPEGIKFEASIWIIDEAVYFFSGNPPFLVAVNHKPIKNGIKSIYDFLWMSSKAIN